MISPSPSLCGNPRGPEQYPKGTTVLLLLEKHLVVHAFAVRGCRVSSAQVCEVPVLMQIKNPVFLISREGCSLQGAFLKNIALQDCERSFWNLLVALCYYKIFENNLHTSATFIPNLEQESTRVMREGNSFWCRDTAQFWSDFLDMNVLFPLSCFLVTFSEETGAIMLRSLKQLAIKAQICVLVQPGSVRMNAER